MTETTPTPDLTPASAAEVSEVEQFLYREARLLDERRFDDWLALLADDVHYWMPTRQTRLSAGRGEDWQLEKELSLPEEMAFFDENKLSLLVRVKRGQMPQAWAEDPPSRTRRFVTNVEVYREGDGGGLLVYSCFLLHRSRMETQEHSFIGQRRDRLRRTQGELEIAERRIVLDANVLRAPNLSVFF